MAAGKEQEENSKQDQNEREEREEQVQKFLSGLGEQQRKKGRSELTTSNLKLPFSSVALGAPEY